MNTRAKSWPTSALSIPSAQNTPASLGTSTPRAPSRRPTAAPCIGPAPPPATSTKRAGSRPRSVLIRSTACNRFCSTRRITPTAASSTPSPSGSPTRVRSAALARSRSSETAPPAYGPGASRPSTSCASVTVGSSPPRP